jgi:transcriptional regulator with PAS, ATPase and Fis domain
MPLQVKLLRVLQERVIERVGDLTPRPVDIRVVSATNKNLEEEIREGRFREDLFYRLNEVTLSLPPLRDRGDDIHELARYFLQKYGEQYDSKARGFTNECVRAMLVSYWPGNVRQLEARVKKAVIMSDRALLNADDLGIRAGDKRQVRTLDDATEDFKKAYIRECLELNNWNKAETARDLGVDPRTIFRYICSCAGSSAWRWRSPAGRPRSTARSAPCPPSPRTSTAWTVRAVRAASSPPASWPVRCASRCGPRTAPPRR